MKIANTQKDRIFLFVDGSNLNAGQFELFGPNHYLSFSETIKQIEKSLGIVFERIYFYASFSPYPKKLTAKAKQYIKNEGLFYQDVRSLNKVHFFRGYRSKTSGKEKEVDVKLAVDIVDMAHQDLYSELFLMSGDADFMHALLIAERENRRISLCAIENRIPHRLSFHYPTYVIKVMPNEMKFHPKQRISLIKVAKRSILKKS